MSTDLPAWLPWGVALIAFIYSMVGHGGASGYLALLALSPMLPRDVAVTALWTNLVVAGTSFVVYRLGRHFSWSLAWPFLASSVPLAYLGSRIALSAQSYYWIVGAVLVFSGLRLWWISPDAPAAKPAPVPGLAVRLGAGSGIGLLSGVVGVGGGIFLSPLLLFARWANAKQTSAVSALFIVVNSAAGLVGRLQDGSSIHPATPGLMLAGFGGALAGSYLGAFPLGQRTLLRMLGLVLILAATKLILR